MLLSRLRPQLYVQPGLQRLHSENAYQQVDASPLLHLLLPLTLTLIRLVSVGWECLKKTAGRMELLSLLLIVLKKTEAGMMPA